MNTFYNPLQPQYIINRLHGHSPLLILKRKSTNPCSNTSRRIGLNQLASSYRQCSMQFKEIPCIIFNICNKLKAKLNIVEKINWCTVIVMQLFSIARQPLISRSKLLVGYVCRLVLSTYSSLSSCSVGLSSFK